MSRNGEWEDMKNIMRLAHLDRERWQGFLRGFSPDLWVRKALVMMMMIMSRNDMTEVKVALPSFFSYCHVGLAVWSQMARLPRCVVSDRQVGLAVWSQMARLASLCPPRAILSVFC